MNEKKIKIICLLGASGTGKDTIISILQQYYGEQYNFIVPITTRPKRNYETDGKEYVFLTNKEFEEQEKNMCEYTIFNDWYYGTSIDCLSKDKINIGIFNPLGYKQLCSHSDLQLYPILIESCNEQRLIRSLLREKNLNCHEICRRFLDDEHKFDWIKEQPNTIIINNNRDIQDVVKEIKNIMDTIL